MVTAAALFHAGWVLRRHVPGAPDPVTGNRRGGSRMEVPGRGLVQDPTFSGTTETTADGVRDDRLVMFRPDDGTKVPVTAADEFVSPDGEVWQCASDGMWRGIPGHRPDYVAARVRRAKEKT